MRTMLSVDPGLRGCGCAFWREDKQSIWALDSAFFVPGVSGRGPAVWASISINMREKISEKSEKLDILAVEVMKVYKQGKARPEDLLEVQGVAGAVVGGFHTAKMYGFLPGEWKGQVPKAVLAARVEKKLRARGWWDLVEVPRNKAYLNDVCHGVGIGFWAIERVLCRQ